MLAKALTPNLHWNTVDIPYVIVKASCTIEKFTKYIFAEGNSKKLLFDLWGYDIMDSQFLQQEFIKQAKLAYSVGDYELGLLNGYGQRITIAITLKRKDKK